jgi:hypothetical protein
MGGGKTPQLKPAFAKTDDFMVWLKECGDETLEALAEARLLTRSTIQETRAGRLLSMASRGGITAYYYYYGAVTSRWAGGDDVNLQNMPSRGRNGTELKECVQAPPGYVLVISDAAQIEARMLATVAGQFDKVQAFRQGRDLYCEFASKVFGFTVNAKEHKLHRTVGKVSILQLGYGSGFKKFITTVAKNTNGLLLLSDPEGKRIVGAYRDDNLAICGHRVGRSLTGGLWQKGDEWLEILARGLSADYWAPEEPGQPHSGQPLLRFRDHKLIFPGGGMLHYDGLYWGVHPSAKDDDERQGWLLPKKKGVERMYGAHMVQHVIQGLSTGCHGHFGEVVLRVNDRLRGWGRVCLITHDDLGAAVREDRKEEAAAIIGEEMSRAPWWLPNAPLASDVQIRRDYAKQ